MTRPTVVVTDPAEIKAVGRRMSEADLQRSVVEACGWFGLLVFHSTDSRRDLCAGFPALLIVGRRTIAVELKSATGRVSVDQQRWLTRLNASGTLATVWRPADLLDGTITETLRNLAQPRTPEAHPPRPAAAPTALRGTPTRRGPYKSRRTQGDAS